MMGKSINTDEQLVEAIHELPSSMEPGRDLWPGISSRLGKARLTRSGGARRPAWFNQAAAASVAVAFVAGLMFGRQMGTGETPAIDSGPSAMTMQATLLATEREYQAAFREFIPVGAANTMLASQDVENIENSWAEMQQAESALFAALREYPDNTYLSQKLLDLRAQQLGFMRQLATLDQSSRRNT